MSFTVIIILITAATSFAAFNNDQLFNRLILWPSKMSSPNEYYRFITSGFIHADVMHLAFNMITLFFFGKVIEPVFADIGLNPAIFVILYLTSIIAASMPSFIKHRNNSYYRSLGASGGVSAILFSFVYFAPWEKITIVIIPVPAIIAAVGYVVYAVYMSKKGNTAINHDAHLWGAAYGFLFTLIVSPDHGSLFLERLIHPYF